MARSVNIDNVTFSQMSLGKDSIVIKYDDSKADQTGEKTSPKNCYPNPIDARICMMTALGCYLSISDAAWSQDDRRTVFRTKNSKNGAASHKYCEKLKHLFKTEMKDVLAEFIRPDHANAHGFPKGSGTEATSGTTCPPPISSVSGRGEWSMGKVLDVYWTFAHAGDQYLGRILAGLDPNSGSFAIIPPHFKDGMGNEIVKKGMNLCFKKVLDTNARVNPNMQGILLRCLASMVHNFSKIMKLIEHEASNPLWQIPVFSDLELRKNLLELVTTEPSNVKCNSKRFWYPSTC